MVGLKSCYIQGSDEIGKESSMLALWMSLLACGDKEDPIIEDTGVQTVSEDCTDGVDNDGDGYIDCEDAECLSDDDCELVEDCTDSIDNDGDGDVDCDDSDCEDSDDCVIEPETDCTNAVDDDEDGDVDCDDTDCTGDAACFEADCADGADNDGDGTIDCDDSDCTNDPACAGGGQENCSNGIDDDGDLLIVLSGSGNSENIVKALNEAKKIKMNTFAILGFDGGKCIEIADNAIHFDVNDMQISEDLQLVVMHMCMQWLSKN